MAEFNRKYFQFQATQFFKDYIRFPEISYDTQNLLTSTAMKEGAEMLIANGVFSGAKDMKMQALKDYSIMLPDWIFN